MDDYLCLTILGEPGEAMQSFKGRLTAFWTHMIRNHPDDYEKVYSEAKEFETTSGRISRQYMIQAELCDLLARELMAQSMTFEPIDADDTYNKAESSSSEWFQIPHD
jgi:hypothetical protein